MNELSSRFIRSLSLENILSELKTVLPNADFVIEGYVDPRELLCNEDTAGDHNGLREARSLKCEVRMNSIGFFRAAGFLRISAFDTRTFPARHRHQANYFSARREKKSPSGAPVSPTSQTFGLG